MQEYIDLIIYIILTIMLLIGFKLAIEPFRHQLLLRMNIFKRYRKIKSASSRITKNKYYSSLLMLFETAFEHKNKKYLYLLLVGSLMITILTVLILSKFFNGPFFIIIFSLALGTLPYLFLFIRLHRIRRAGSGEIEELLVELISQYRINHFNMYEAIDQAIIRLDAAPYTKAALIRLSIAVKQATSDAEIIIAVNQFNFVYKTNWSGLLADNLKKSFLYGENIYQALEDILEESKIMKNIYEKDRQMNSEALFMIKYVTPTVYLLSIYAMVAIIGFDFSKFINYQFYNPVGFKFFSLILLLMVINTTIYLIFKQRKRDF